MNECLVSLIMLTYNRKQYLERSLNCCLNQDFNDYEIILINNNSTDGSEIICEKYASENPRVKYYSNDNSNISSGRNLGVLKSTGDYILFVDDDDYFENDLVSFLYNNAVENNADCSICGSGKEVNGEVIQSNVFDEKVAYSTEEALFELLKRQKFNAALPTKMFKRTLFENLKIDESVAYDDIVFTYKIMAECNKVVFDGSYKYTFMRHTSNNSSFTTNDKLITPKQLDVYFAAFKERSIYLTDKFPDMRHYWYYTEWSYMISMVNKISLNELVDCYPQRDYAKSVLLANLDEFSGSEYLLDFEVEFIEKYLR